MRQARTTAWRLYEDVNGRGRTRQKHEPEFFEEQAALSGACEIAPAQTHEEGVAGACDDEYAVGAPGEDLKPAADGSDQVGMPAQRGNDHGNRHLTADPYARRDDVQEQNQRSPAHRRPLDELGMGTSSTARIVVPRNSARSDSCARARTSWSRHGRRACSAVETRTYPTVSVRLGCRVRAQWALDRPECAAARPHRGGAEGSGCPAAPSSRPLRCLPRRNRGFRVVQGCRAAVGARLSRVERIPWFASCSEGEYLISILAARRRGHTGARTAIGQFSTVDNTRVHQCQLDGGILAMPWRQKLGGSEDEKGGRDVAHLKGGRGSKGRPRSPGQEGRTGKRIGWRVRPVGRGVRGSRR